MRTKSDDLVRFRFCLWCVVTRLSAVPLAVVIVGRHG